jgi:HemY protein
MKWLFSILLILLIAIMLGLYAYQDPGYVLIARGQQTAELSLTLFVILIVVGFALLYFALQLFFGLWGMPGSLRRWRLRQRRERAWRETNRGLIELAQGQWEKAERFLIRHAFDSATPLINYLSAARAAQKQNRPDKRDEYLALAHQHMANASFAVELTQAELQLTHGQLPQSLVILLRLHAASPKHPHVLYLLARLYELLRNWAELKQILPALRKRAVYSLEALNQLEQKVYRELLTIATQRGKPDELAAQWKDLPRAQQQNPDMARHYVRCLLTLEQTDQAEVTLRDTLRHGFDNDLVYLYGLITVKDKDKQLAAAETWLSGNENNPVLLLSLGRLCTRNRLWGKARAYLDASVSIQARSDTYYELGQLMEKINQPGHAADYYRQGLLLAHEEKLDDALTVTPIAPAMLPMLV